MDGFLVIGDIVFYPEVQVDPVDPMGLWVADDDDDAWVAGNNYVYGTDGIYDVPVKHIVRDSGDSLPIRARKWRSLKEDHRAFCAASVLKDEGITSRHIVVLQKEDEQHGKRCLWFVRFALSGGCVTFEESFGESFLWQLPNSACGKIMAEIRQYEVDNQLAVDQRSLLGSTLASTFHDFDPAEWGFPRVEKLNNYYDRVFAMCIAPAAKPLRTKSEGWAPSPYSLARPTKYQHTVNLCEKPDDVQTLLVQVAANRYLTTTSKDDWSAFLNMRLVCKAWRNEADDSGKAHFQGVLGHLRTGLQSCSVDDLTRARDAVLRSGLMTMSIILDAHEPSVYNLMRVRGLKRPRSKPPSAGSEEERPPPPDAHPEHKATPWVR